MRPERSRRDGFRLLSFRRPPPLPPRQSLQPRALALILGSTASLAVWRRSLRRNLFRVLFAGEVSLEMLDAIRPYWREKHVRAFIATVLGTLPEARPFGKF